MKNRILKYTWVGAMTGVVSAVAYAIVAYFVAAFWAVIFSGTSVASMFEFIPTYFLYSSILLFVPGAFVFALMSVFFTFLISRNTRLGEKAWTGFCTMMCLFTALVFFIATRGMIFNIDEETTIMLNIMFRTIPYTLFVIWGYFLSRYIYRKTKQPSNG